MFSFGKILKTENLVIQEIFIRKLNGLSKIFDVCAMKTVTGKWICVIKDLGGEPIYLGSVENYTYQACIAEGSYHLANSFSSKTGLYTEELFHLDFDKDKIIELIKWEQSNNIGFLNMTVLSFVIDHRWEALQDIKDGKLNNVTFNVIESL